MKITNIPGNDTDKLDQAIRSFHMQRVQEFFSPKLMSDLSTEEIRQDGGLITATEEGEYLGVLSYLTLMPQSLTDLEKAIREDVVERAMFTKSKLKGKLFDDHNLPHFRSYSFTQPLIFIEGMEAFRKGVGAEMLAYVKQEIPVEGVFLRPLGNIKKLRDHYKKNEFVETPLRFTDSTLNIMLWLNPTYTNQ